MSPYFICHDCSSVPSCQQDTKQCSSCGSSNGHIITDEEFKKGYEDGTIKLINPRTGKPYKRTTNK